MSGLIEIINIVSPVFLLIGLGLVLGRRGWLPAETNDRLSKLVFYVAGPALLFRSAAATTVSEAISPLALAWMGLVSVLTAFAVYLAARPWGPARRGVMAQGSHRSNMVFVALPVIANALGEKALGPVAIMIGFMVPIYNALAVLVLTLPHRGRESWGRVWTRTAREIVTNPLIIGTAAGLVVAGLDLPLPLSADRTLELLARIAMPLALLVVGASLDLGRLRAELGSAALVALIKLVVYPALVYIGLKFLGLSGPDLHAPVLLLAAPTAVVSTIMAREMKGDEQLASAIVIGTTIASLFTISLWLALFRLGGG